MKESAEDRASEASAQSTGRETVLPWLVANRMLPLVQRIVADVLECRTRLVQSQAEKAPLDRQRQTLVWTQRARRYQLQEDIVRDEGHLRLVLAELDSLGLTLLDDLTGRVGFPTLVNRRRAYFSWMPGEATLAFWHYPDDAERRPIPATWMKTDSRRKKNR
jgi:hypothetical protein